MDMRQLEAFVNVVKLGSFSRAAETIYLTQPTISAHIGTLEKELGAQLLIRSTKEVYPTKIGREFYEYAQNILALRDQAAAAVKQHNQQVEGELDILAAPVPAQFLLPQVVTGFSQKHPGVLFRTQVADGQELVRELNACRYDFGLTGALPGSQPRFHCKPVYSDSLVIAMPKGQVWDGDMQTLLTTSPFVAGERSTSLWREAEGLLAYLGLAADQLQTVAYFHDTQSVVSAVANGLGISIIPGVAAQPYTQQGIISTVPVGDGFGRKNIYLVSKKEMVLTPVQSLFAQYMHSFADRQSA